MKVLVSSRIFKSKRAGCAINVCGLDCTRLWRKPKKAEHPVNTCGSVCTRLACVINL